MLVLAVLAQFGVSQFVETRTPDTRTSTTAATTPTSEYENEDYQLPTVSDPAPRMPMPGETQANDWLTNNKIYSITMATPVRCDAEPVDATILTSAELTVQLNDVLDCLLRVWGPALEEAGFTPTRPTITVLNAESQTACGKMRMQNAMFCSSDQNLYFASDLPDLFDPELADQPWVVESVLAHEYAHAFQGRTGIIQARNALADQAPNKEAEYLLVRRNEAQADCLSGMFWNATQRSLELTDQNVATITETFRSIGSDRDGRDRLSTHPKMATRARWVTTGLNATSIGACNTYSVPADEVA